MKKIKATIKGKSPLLMHKLNVQDLMKTSARKVAEKDDFEAMAFNSAYWNKAKNMLIIPSQNIYRCLLSASSFRKVKGRSLKALLAGCVRIEPFEISLGTKKYDVDIRAVNNRGNRILIGRPVLENWKATFDILYDETFIDPEVLKEVLEEAGTRVGLMAFRPQKSGSFGSFEVTGWKVE